jgi:hypothetical protein
MKFVNVTIIMPLAIHTCPVFAQSQAKDADLLEIVLNSGEAVQLQLTTYEDMRGGHITISGNNLYLKLVLDGDLLGASSYLSCSDAKPGESLPGIFITAHNYWEWFFHPSEVPGLPPVDYSIMTGDYKAVWDHTLAIFRELNDKSILNDYVNTNAPQLLEDVKNAVRNIIAGFFIPYYNIDIHDLLPPGSESSPKPSIGYGVGTPAFSLLERNYSRLYRIVCFSGEHSFALNSYQPSFTPGQGVVVESRDEALQGISEIIINPRDKTLRIKVNGEELPELTELYNRHRMLYSKKIRLAQGLDLPGNEDTFSEEDQKELDSLEAEINRITQELSQTIKMDRWSEGIEFIKNTLGYMETRIPEFNRDVVDKTGFDVEILAPIVLEAFNSYTPEIEIISWSSRDAMDDVLRQRQGRESPSFG